MNIISFDTTRLTTTIHELQTVVATANYESVLKDLQTSVSDEFTENAPNHFDVSGQQRSTTTRRTASNRPQFHDRDSSIDENASSYRVTATPRGLLFRHEPLKTLFRQEKNSDESNHDFYGLSEEKVQELVNRIGDVTVEKLKTSQE